MSLSKYQIFLRTVECGSFTKAAESMSFTQSGVSHIIAALEEECDRVTAAKAADELLTLKGVQASFVLYPKGDGVYISARSLGEVNVQVIVEALGGGGNSTTAGGQLRDGNVADCKQHLLAAIDDYFEK